MKKNIYLIVGLVLLIFVWSNSSFAADKIGFVDLKKVVEKYTSDKKEWEDFEKLQKNKKAPLVAAEKELRKLKDDLDKQASMMTAKARTDKEAAYQKKLRDFQLLVNDTNEDLQKRGSEMFQKLTPVVDKAISVIAEREKYILIMVINVPGTPVAYYAKENDISTKVIEELNKKK